MEYVAKMNLDMAIVVAFLIMNLGLGIMAGKGIKTIKEYAIGDRNFSTATLAATIIATWISGSYFTVCISQTYTEGVWFIPAVVAEMISLLVVGYVLASRMKEFFGSISVAETMGNLYGKNVRFITAICSIAQAVGMTALQIQVFSSVFSYFLEFSYLYATCICSCVVIFYSTWGGIKAVTFTDTIQFLTFGIFIPLFFFFVCKVFGDVDAITNAVQTNPILDYTQLINWQNPKFWPGLAMFIWFLVPDMSSTAFQRVLMAKDTKQVGDAFKIAAIGFGFVLFLSCAIGLIVLSVDQSLDADRIVTHTLDHYSFNGLKGLTLVGIIAMVMSTADSWINTSSVIFAHDICKPLGIKKNPLVLSRIFAVFLGASSLLLVLFKHNLFVLFALQSSFYMPIITVPLILTIFGFRSSGKAVIIGMVTGALCTILWNLYLQDYTGINSIFPAMIMNLITLLASHYILGEPGGWVGIKDDSDLKALRSERHNRMKRFKKFFHRLFNMNIHDIDISAYFSKRLPKSDSTYIYFAITVMLSPGITVFLLSQDVYHDHLNLITALQGMACLLGTIFVTHTLWRSYLSNKYIGIIWCVSIFIGFAFISSFLVIISNFSQIAVVILMLNLITIALLMGWKTTLVMMLSGMYLALFAYQHYMGDSKDIAIELHDMKWNIVYILLAIAGLSISFLKPKQDHDAVLEETNEHLKQTLQYHDEELQKALDLKYEFLRNLEHEARTPITGIATLGQVLHDSYDSLTDQQRRDALKDIADSSQRLTGFVNNMIDLSKLSSLTYELDFDKVDLSELLAERLDACKRMYLNEKPLEFITKIDDDVVASCDRYYVSSVFDNLIVNAINYSSRGKIVISLKNGLDGVEFSIADQGIGIPTGELYDIFGTFVVSSKTRTPSGGRGVGLALCKKVLEMHKGKIWAESDGEKGAVFRFVF